MLTISCACLYFHAYDLCGPTLFAAYNMFGRNMLHGPWKEANASIVTLHVDDSNVNGEAIEMALAYIYGHHPKLNDNNAFRVLAAASFLDLQVSNTVGQ